MMFYLGWPIQSGVHALMPRVLGCMDKPGRHPKNVIGYIYFLNFVEQLYLLIIDC